MALLTRREVVNLGAMHQDDTTVLNKVVLMSSGVKVEDLLALFDLIDHYGKHLDIS
jgi:hypothetical protein